MTLLVEDSSKTFIGAGTVGPFTWTWRFFDNDDITAKRISDEGVETALVETTDYTLTGANTYQGGVLTLVAVLAVGETLYVERNSPALQEVDLRNQGDFFPETYEEALDKTVAMVQDKGRAGDNSLRYSPPATGVSRIFPAPVPLNLVRFTADALGLESIDVPTLLPGGVVEADLVERVKDIFSLINVSDPDVNKTYFVLGFFFTAPVSNPKGGGSFIWQAGLNKNIANGATIVDPDNTGGFDGTISTRDAFLNAQGSGIGTGCWVRTESYQVLPSWYGIIGGTDEGVAIKIMVNNHKNILWDDAQYESSIPIFDGVHVIRGLEWHGVGRDLLRTTGTRFAYTGTGTLVNFQEDLGQLSVGSLRFKNMVFTTTDDAGSLFNFNDLSIPPTDDANSQNFIREVKFENCLLRGPGTTTVTGFGITAIKTFELVMDENCEVYFFLRGVHLKGCDNCTIGGRMAKNGRNVMIESVLTFGNDNLVNARWLAIPLESASEQGYCLWDSGFQTTVLSTDLEVNDDSPTAIPLFIDGFGGRYINLGMHAAGAAAVPFKMGSNVRNAHMSSPYTTSVLLAPIVLPSDSIDISNTLGNYPGLTISDPSERFLQYVKGTEMVRYSSGAPLGATPATLIGGERFGGGNGPTQKNMIISPLNYKANSAGLGYSQPRIISDQNSYIGQAIQLLAVNQSGFGTFFTVGEVVNEGDTIKIVINYKMSGTPAAGAFKWKFSRNGLLDQLSGSLAVSTSYASQSESYVLSGFVAGDTVDVRLYNAGVIDHTCNIAGITVSVADPAIADTSGANVGALEVEVNDLKAVLRNYGMIGD